MTDKNNYLSRVTYQGGKDSYEFPFSYLRRDFVKAQIDLSERESNTLTYMVDYTIDDHTLKLTKPVDADKTITIYRETSSKPLVEYEDASILRAYDLNLSQRQNLNILEEQTDIVGKNYSFTHDMKDYMYAELTDTKTAIDNKMSETLDTVDSKLTTAQADVNKAVSDMNASLDKTKQFVNSSVSTMNDTVNATKKSVEASLAEMNTTVANTKKSVEDSLATTTTSMNDVLNKVKDAENSVNETKEDITKLADELNETYSSLQEDIKNISATNRNTAYKVGDQIHSSYLPFNCYITCVTAGTTGDTLPVLPEGDHDSGFTYTDGTATFKIDYWPLSINGKKPLNKAGDITIDTATNANHASTADRATTATTVNATAPNGGATDLVFGTMAANDYARIRVGGSSDYGWLEIATADAGTEPIYVRQYNGAYDWPNGRPGTVTNEAVLLDGSGNTKFPKNVTATNFNGHLVGNADTATTATNATNAGNADTVDGYHASDIINRITAANTGGIVAASLTANGYVKFANGLILQWGNASGGVSVENSTTFPIAFPSTCFAVFVSSKVVVNATLRGYSNTGFKWIITQSTDISWAALGM